MAALQYVGARYVPVFYKNPNGSWDWEAGASYEPLTIVKYGESSFISRMLVPPSVGAPNTSPEYWAQTGNYNGYLLEIQEQIDAIKYYERPEDYGADANGASDDTEAFQAALNSAQIKGTFVLLTQGHTYSITSLQVVSSIHGNGASVKVNSSSYGMTCSIPEITISGIKMNVVSGNGIRVMANRVTVIDCHIAGNYATAINNANGYESIFQRIFFDGNGRGTAIQVNTTDGHYIDCIGIDNKKAFVINRAAVIERAHFWIMHSEYFEGSSFAEINNSSPSLMTNCNCDTYQIMFNFTAAPSVIASSCLCLYNYANVPSNVASYLIGLRNYVDNRKNIRNIKLTGCRIEQPQGRTFHLCNAFTDDNLFPLETTNCVLPYRENDSADISSLLGLEEGSLLINYGKWVNVNIKKVISDNQVGSGGLADYSLIFGNNFYFTGFINNSPVIVRFLPYNDYSQLSITTENASENELIATAMVPLL